MGEARRKLEARAACVPEPRPDRCPACNARDVHYLAKGTLPEFDCEVALCRACGAVWEPFAPHYVHDPVGAEPCDNCAFRPGSPEQRDSEAWKKLIEALDPANAPEGWPFAGRFYCHKNVPIDMAAGPGNFLFPKRKIVFNGVEIETHDIRKMRTCSGFLRMVWAKNGVTKDRKKGSASL